MRRADDGVLGGEPFFRVLHEQHPEVDLVILPPIDSRDPDQPLASVDEVAQRADAARSALHEVLHAVGHPASNSFESWPFDDSPVARRLVIRTAIRDIPDDTATPLLRQIGDALLTLGWDARGVASSRPELLASDGRHLLGAEVVAGSVDVLLQTSILAAPETIDAVREARR
jgi:hypothetical protein